MEEQFPTIQHAIVKVVGIFDYKKQFQNEVLGKLGYQLMHLLFQL
jgi:hypothetical protein